MEVNKNVLIVIAVVFVLVLVVWMGRKKETQKKMDSNYKVDSSEAQNCPHPDDMIRMDAERRFRKEMEKWKYFEENQDDRVRGSSSNCSAVTSYASPSGTQPWTIDFVPPALEGQPAPLATKQNMLKMAILCELAYAYYSRSACRKDYTGINPDTTLSTQFGMKTSGDVNQKFTILSTSDGPMGFMHLNTTTGLLVISFRGTQTSGEWVKNVKFGKTDLTSSTAGNFVDSSRWKKFEPRCEVCTGFFQSAVPFVSTFDTFITNNRSSIKNIILTGHSLGGAIAVMYALRLIYTHQFSGTVMNLYNFSAPRVATIRVMTRLSNDLRGRIFSFVVEQDIVPDYPTTTWWDADSFADTGRYIYRDNTFTYDAEFERYVYNIGFNLDLTYCHSLNRYFGTGQQGFSYWNGLTTLVPTAD